MSYRPPLLWLGMALLFIALFTEMAGKDFVYVRNAVKTHLDTVADGTAHVGRWMR
jgi:hypothetical protein